MKRPKRHHFVPRWYLEGFVDPRSGFLHVYDKTTRAFRTQKSAEVMVINNYYQQKHAPDGVDPDILERLLGSWLEPKAKSAFKKLLNQQPLTEEDTAHILAYLELQRIRVPRQAEIAKQILETEFLVQALHARPDIMTPEFITAIMKGEITIELNDSYRFNVMKIFSRQLSPYFARMVWEIGKAEGSSFITSDSPVSFVNRAPAGP